MICIGIDPGLSGAVFSARRHPGGSLEFMAVCDTPVLLTESGRDYHAPAMADVLRSMALGGEAEVVIERAQAMPKQGVSSMFHYGRGYGMWLGILGALGLPFRTVRPNEWTKVLKGTPGKGKARSIQFASMIFPDMPLIPKGCRKPRDGRADAACMVWWALRGV